MLAAVNFNAGTGALTVVGNAIADTISLTGSNDYQSFTVDINNNASLQQTFNYSDVTSVKVLAGDGDDFVYNTLLIDTEIFGQDGNDHLEGGYANDRVIGGNGSDTLVGRNGDDVLNGQAGNDRLFGVNGDDALIGQTGNDQLFGGTGNDTLVGDEGVDALRGEDGNDILRGGDDDDILFGGSGNDTLRGEQGDDRLRGEDGDDALHGDQGNDELLGQAGNDILIGGTGNDELYGREGDDTLRGDEGNDTLNGGLDNDLLLGREGDDVLRGGLGDDILRGEEGSDSLFGDAGDDSLDAGNDGVRDELTGGTGLDQFLATTSVDEVTDRESFETYPGYTGPVTPLINVVGDTITIRGSESADRVEIRRASTVRPTDEFQVWLNGEASGTYSILAINKIVFEGNGGNDVFKNIHNYTTISMEVDGGAGDDYLETGGGNDILRGGAGADVLWGGQGDDILFAGDDVAVDELRGQGGFDEFFANANDIVHDQTGDEPVGTAGTASIGDLVFEDTNGNQAFDTGESGISDVTLTLFSGTTVIATQTTDSTGFYSFGNLSAGDYRVELTTDLKYDYDLTTPTSVDVSLADGQVINSVDFGAQPLPPGTASIGDLVFEDLNEDGVFDSGEVGLQSVLVRLFRGNQELDSQLSDSNGGYLFDGLRAGNYRVEIVNDSSSLQYVTTADVFNVTLADDESLLEIDIGLSEDITLDEYAASVQSTDLEFRNYGVLDVTASFPVTAGPSLLTQGFPFVIPSVTRADVLSAPGSTINFAPAVYNCHSHAWHNGQADPIQDPNIPQIAVDATAQFPRWDNSAIDDMAEATLLSENDIPVVGDIVVYAKDFSENGAIDFFNEATHSAIVTEVTNGEITKVTSKLGRRGIVTHHPNDPYVKYSITSTAFGVVSGYGEPMFVFRK